MRDLLVAVVVMVVLPVRAQPPTTTALRTRLAASPDDTALLCDLGWAEHLAGDDVSAQTHLDHAIALLGEPTEPAQRARLGACLYSRGRVDEASDWASSDAIARYTRSVALRPNATVQARLDVLTAMRAAEWADDDTDEDDALTAAVAALHPTWPADVTITAMRTDAATTRSVALVQVWFQHDGYGDHERALAVHDASGEWSVASLGEMPETNGSIDDTLHVAPGPGGSPTFVIVEHWDNRACCDDEGMPDWTEGANVGLVWRDADGAWRSAWLDDDAWPTSGTVRFEPDGDVIVDRPSGALSGRLRRLVGAHPRDAWLAP